MAVTKPILKRNLHLVSLEEIGPASRALVLQIETVFRFSVCVAFGNKILTPRGNEWVDRHLGRHLQNSGGEAIVTIRKL